MDCQPWPIDETCLPADWPEDDQVAAHFVQMASEILHALSGRTVGLCRYTVRPCRGEYDDPCEGPCGCAPVCRVTVGDGDVQCVEEVRIDGVVLPRSGWRVYAGGVVVLTQGRCFPQCQELDRGLGEPGTWGITYIAGQPVTPLGSRAVTLLAAELARECAQSCGQQTRNLQSISVEGETRIFDGENRWGHISAVEDWLDVVNPYRSRRQGRFYTPGQKTHWMERQIGIDA